MAAVVRYLKGEAGQYVMCDGTYCQEACAIHPIPA